MTIKALCCIATRRDGEVLRATNLDVDLDVTETEFSGTYEAGASIELTAVKSNSNMAVDNVEAGGAMSPTAMVNGQLRVSRSDIEGGLWDQARAVIFECDTENTSAVTVLIRGPIGKINRTHEGAYRAEVRNLFQLLGQNMGETVSLTCRAILGSGAETPSIKRCGVNLAAFAVAGSITSIVRDRYEWDDSSLAQAVNYFLHGIVTWTGGANADIRSEIRRHPSTGRIVLDATTPFPMQVGDTYSVTPGCSKVVVRDASGLITGDCKDKFDNFVNFRGEPDTPGMDAVLAGGGAS